MATSKKAAGSNGSKPPPPPPGNLPHSNPRDRLFTPEVLDRSPIAIPLLNLLQAEDEALGKNPGQQRQAFPVIIDRPTKASPSNMCLANSTDGWSVS